MMLSSHPPVLYTHMFAASQTLVKKYFKASNLLQHLCLFSCLSVFLVCNLVSNGVTRDSRRDFATLGTTETKRCHDVLERAV